MACFSIWKGKVYHNPTQKKRCLLDLWAIVLRPWCTFSLYIIWQYKELLSWSYSSWWLVINIGKGCLFEIHLDQDDWYAFLHVSWNEHIFHLVSPSFSLNSFLWRTTSCVSIRLVFCQCLGPLHIKWLYGLVFLLHIVFVNIDACIFLVHVAK